MVNDWKLLPSFSVIASVLLCCALTAAGPLGSRTVKKLSRPGAPVEIIAVKVKGKALKFGKPFAAKNDWLGGLTLVIKNTSAKSVSWVKLGLNFHKAKESKVRLVAPVIYGIGRSDLEKLRGGAPSLKPGETAEVLYPVDQYQSIREIMDGMGYPKSVAEVEVSVEQVSFEGEPDVMWIQGKMNREDYRSPTGWSPVKP